MLTSTGLALGALAAHAEGPVELLGASPADGSTVEKLDFINTTWGNYEITEWASNSRQAVSVCRDGELVCYGTLRSVPSGVQVRLAEAQTEEGVYTVTIEPDMVGDVDVETFQLLAGTGNKAVTLTYYIGDTVKAGAVLDDMQVKMQGRTLQVTGAANVQVEVIDMSGRAVYRGIGNDQTLDISNGVYIVRLSAGQAVKQFKIALH